MEANTKARVARVLGYICMVAGALNLTIALLGRVENSGPLLGTGVGALTIGIIMVALGRKQPGA